MAASHDSRTALTFPNTQEGFESFLANYNTQEALIVLETTGGYEKLYIQLKTAYLKAALLVLRP